MKSKLSVTVDRPLVRFLDSLPGQSRSQKLERILRRFRDVSEDLALRKALAKQRTSGAEQTEHDAWRQTMEEDQWTESDEATSGRSNS
jgi:hypothetical protein